MNSIARFFSLVTKMNRKVANPPKPNTRTPKPQTLFEALDRSLACGLYSVNWAEVR